MVDIDIFLICFSTISALLLCLFTNNTGLINKKDLFFA